MTSTPQHGQGGTGAWEAFSAYASLDTATWTALGTIALVLATAVYLTPFPCSGR
jgi:hypothetical protein